MPLAPPPDLTHTQKHGLKYFTAGAMAIVVTLLQMFGVLSPLICVFTPDPNACRQAGIAATVASQELGTIKLDDGTSLPLVTEYNDGGVQ